MRLNCLGDTCNLCCRATGGDVIVSSSEAKALAPEAVRGKGEVFVLKSIDGACAMLKQGKCSCYRNRPRGCREYPWYNVDGKLHYDSGCPGVKFDSDERPAPAVMRPIEAYFPTSRLGQRVIIWLLLHW